jgi:hypothetical protein
MTDIVNFQIQNKGFGSYLAGILPEDQAVSCGAFAFSMSQIKNIINTQIQDFAQVVYSLETNVNLPLTNGTNIPTDKPLAIAGLDKIALGSGPYGTFTMSDFFGSMSGLPYAWEQIYTGISSLQTPTLSEIYKNLWLATQWEQATVNVQYTSYVGPGPTTYYTVTGFTITNDGGGYIRENAPVPTITVSNGATASVVIGTNPADIGVITSPNGGGTYGRVISVNLISPGPDSTSIPTAVIAPPPGSLPMDSVIQAYIDQANAEIANIYNSADPTTNEQVNLLNTNYNVAGQQLALEQRARYLGILPVPAPGRDATLNFYPLTTIGFVDSLPTYSQNTLPHMQNQTLEGIVDFCTTGGQSLLGLLRESRNQARLDAIGIGIDTNVSNQLAEESTEQLLVNGTVKLARPNAGINGYTLPAYPQQATCDGDELTPQPILLYDNTDNIAVVAIGATTTGNIKSIINGGNIVAVSSVVPTGPYLNPLSVTGTTAITLGSAGAVVAQIPNVTGSVANTQPILPIQLNTAYTASSTLQSTPSIQEAIDTVIKCNCDCWIT